MALAVLDVHERKILPGTASFAIAQVSENEAVIRGFGRGMGETIRAVTIDGGSMQTYSG